MQNQKIIHVHPLFIYSFSGIKSVTLHCFSDVSGWRPKLPGHSGRTQERSGQHHNKYTMKQKNLIGWACLLTWVLTAPACRQTPQEISLAGEWQFALDPKDVGLKEE